ncbi:carbamoyl phosphate synthase large subunit [Bacillus sp. 1NLA3E]|uniref:carbamoyl phosphate synthase large subunit n=1 Tax=Bacillus sp. 1NLA3E TaxID=666686 RepID=UPI000247E540|nr:carbamoyl phosphate synthase large subunit [Bacillus sp. 1NLA3E]AGK52717.1 carbamoyl phosphate synthase large subunit [Bacillus sp. 1NLA3E]
MPKDTSIQSILVIGSGPIVIGQAAEFDYAGTQACMALKEEGYRVILVNNNPATIMTDEFCADSVYFEPLTVESLEKIIAKERPDGMLATIGGQVGLNLAFALSEAGIIEKYGVNLLGTSIDSIKKGEDREAFRTLMNELGEPVPDSTIVHSHEEAVSFAEEIGFPIIIRPAYTLGGTGGGIANNHEELIGLVTSGLQESAIHQCLIEKSIAGYKEVEYEVMRDSMNTCITVCNMENIDPVGIHTGDSIVVAPSQTLTDDEYQMLRSASIKIISALKIVGGCNIQFALDPNSKQYYLIEVNPRVSRSSALASKATGYPIARMAAKLAVGYSLSELINPVTGETFASFEPALDYVVVKFPKWAFDKFPQVDRKLGTQMKATGEVMGIDRNLERALFKAIHSLEIDNDDLALPILGEKSLEELTQMLKEQTDERLFIIFELLRRGVDIHDLHAMTKIDLFYLIRFKKLIDLESEIINTDSQSITKKALQLYKKKGFSDHYLARQWGITEAQVRKLRKEVGILPAYKMVDTCAAEFHSISNYYYSSYDGENEQTPSNKQKVLIIGSGPIRIGQGIEFDYCSVHGVLALKDENIETIMINNNPETVSTDFATADKLYFEPLTIESILNVVDAEGITDVIVQLGGQTSLNLAKELEDFGVNLLGTSSEMIDFLEDRERFYSLLDELEIPHVRGDIANNEVELLEAVQNLGYPILLRPSYVIGGKGMEVIKNQQELESTLASGSVVYPILVDQYIYAQEAELDLAADGVDIFVPTIVEHIEKTGVHSGDSLAILPAQSFSTAVEQLMISYAGKMVKKLQYKGLMNIQFIVDGENVLVLEVNPRASRTVPIVSKVTGQPLVQIATKILLGKLLLSNSSEQYKTVKLPFTCIKYPVFSNYALRGLDSKVGPEMKSTGEGISIAENLEEGLAKWLHVNVGKKIQGGKLICSNLDDITELKALAEKVNIEVVQTDMLEEMLTDKNTVAFYDTQKQAIDILARQKATRNRIPTFTEKETMKAFLTAVAVEDWNVQPIGHWHQTINKDVTVG